MERNERKSRNGEFGGVLDMMRCSPHSVNKPASALRRTLVRRFALSIALAVLLIGASPSAAHAGVMDKVKQWFELPGQVDDLREQYDATRQQLDDATKQIDETARQSRETIEQYRQSEQRLREENERLAKQNEQLAQAVSGLQDAERARSDRSRRTWTLIWTAVGLVGLYFVSSRLFRVLLRSKHS
jgi:septal ring factor EnvC (AmiA/AmiB activator)